VEFGIGRTALCDKAASGITCNVIECSFFSKRAEIYLRIINHKLHRSIGDSHSSSLVMSGKKTSSPKSAAGTLSRLETEDAEEIQQPTAYDRLPAVIATFPATFKDLEVEQRYLNLSSIQRFFSSLISFLQ
jgi:hypothetical protein